ncbi:MAG: hypothetical protein HND39_00265 [Ignavibacteriota bacterium]|jgi:hypothetical protein|nr:MAG: hypothetical protein EDM72_09060 [Chlorobiota bacterium]MBE7477576.1 hypothetical protein [Ignavibacteriales bacterium]MBL1124264.1 hypothetical protein [Ignavibacteriota bacterium]MCC7095445.1 hypothetical protein [Ignavibacteriaceae bacterium]MCE7855377.1 hypothetical protein [Ignavibacteria bacterium CHB3]MEB2296278.1 hypothetical protein [Ignavibacteria bacterium]
MKYIILLLSIFFFSNLSNSQIPNPVHYQNQNIETSNKESFLLGLPDNSLLMIWFSRSSTFLGTLNSARSTDSGITWSYTNPIIEFGVLDPVDINAVILNSGRILLTFKSVDNGINRYRYMYSDDNGENWLGYSDLPTINPSFLRRYVGFTSMSKLSDGSVMFVFSFSQSNAPHQGIFYIRSNDGIYWNSNQIIDSTGSNGYIISAGPDRELLVYETTETEVKNIVYRTSSDGGSNWSDEQILISDDYDKFKPRIIKDNTNKLWLLYYRNDPSVFQNYFQSEIYYSTSADEGLSWSQPEKFTNYSGEDNLLSLSSWDGAPIVSFASTRNYEIERPYYQIYFGIPGISIDVSTPPFLYAQSIIPEYPGAIEQITFRIFADDENLLSSAKKQFTINGISELINMYDDGMHGDSLSGDNIFGYILEDGLTGEILNYDFILTDVDNNSAGFVGSTLPNFTINDKYLVDINKLKLTFTRKGILADVIVDSIYGLQFEESSVLFSGGFMLSGYNQNQLWTNGVLSSGLVEDYLPGHVGIPPTDPRNSIYVIKASDPPFSQSWLNYAYAVHQGADYYDGDENGSYNPVDLNGNGLWDWDEDRPDILGDVTAWCVYNDGLPAIQRRWNMVSPMGIEIHQTLFAIGDETNAVDNMIFIRYRIKNSGTVSTQFDSVIFGIWDDPDIGFESSAPIDDLSASDLNTNLGYSYNDGEDAAYGNNPPAFGTKLLAGPVVYIPGETFIDINGNGVYDDGIDTPLDTAIVNRGDILGTKYYPGAKNNNISAFVHFLNGVALMGDPNDHLEARNFLLGKNRFGEIIDPCSYQYGQVFGIPCNQVNPKFLFSGDPVTNNGWINTSPDDQRILTSTGPFTLNVNEDIDIWVTYIVGRGSSALESVTKLKQYSSAASRFYESNFTELPSRIREDQILSLQDFILFQNYPNPFNPSTVISYQLPVTGFVTLKVFDILGKEVAVLVNEEKPAGNYEVEFSAKGGSVFGGNAIQLSSGVYFYQLLVSSLQSKDGKAGSFIETRKMVLLK